MKKWFRFVSVFLTAICCLGATCCYAEGTSEDHGDLLLCEYSILGGMENEHLVMTLTQGSGADILTVEEGQEGYDWLIEDSGMEESEEDACESSFELLNGDAPTPGNGSLIAGEDSLIVGKEFSFASLKAICTPLGTPFLWSPRILS